MKPHLVIREPQPFVIAPLPRAARSQWAGVVRMGGIGDNLIAASVLRPLRSLGYQIDVLTKMPQAVVFENNPFIDKLSVKEDAQIPPLGTIEHQKWFWSRGQEYDRFINLSHSCEALMAQFPAATAFWWPAEWRRKHCGQSYIEAVHDIVGVPHEFGPLFFPTGEEKDNARETRERVCGDRRMIGWCIKGTRIDKAYPQAPIAIARLIREFDAVVVLIGGPQDHVAATAIGQHVAEMNGSMDGLAVAVSPDAENPSWPIRRLLTFAMACDLMIGPDTGPMWAVAFEKIPKIMLHGHASVQNITKHWINTTSLHADAKVGCWPCHLLHDEIGTCHEMQRQSGMKPVDVHPACIRSISVDAVMSAAKQALGT